MLLNHIRISELQIEPFYHIISSPRGQHILIKWEK